MDGVTECIGDSCQYISNNSTVIVATLVVVVGIAIVALVMSWRSRK